MTELVFTPAAPVELLSREAAHEALSDLGEVLFACVRGGAGVGFVEPFETAEAVAFWQQKLDGLENGERYLLGLREEGRIVGTVLLEPASQPNGIYRADVAKLLVHPGYRRRGHARRLLAEVDRLALALGHKLLVLDTVTGDTAESVYPKAGYQRVGIIPDFALLPNGEPAPTTVFYKQL
ncbi:GNAT family N-acetyltransferase [Roseibium sp.]|uniref:GNAT family N-acetyltransferase n=1 Tax=Roseibium sp. TaxID=1936156 RepID=UPI003A972679